MANLFHFFGNRKRFLQIILCSFVLSSNISVALAQGGITIQGKVIDERDNESIIGATITLKNAKSNSGTVTDIDGVFSLNVPSLPATIVVTYVGYRPEEIDIYEKPSGIITISLGEDRNALDEVVIVGYQQTKKAAITSAYSTVKLDQIDNVPSPSITEKLQGAVPGLLIAKNSGAPGAGNFVRLRGAVALGGGGPLYIIDGVPFEGSSQQINLSQDADPLAEFNPEDIETVTVLKDAGATAAYGTRAAGGVILITTKRGQRNAKTRVNFKGEVGLSQNNNLWELTTGPEHAAIVNEVYKNDGTWEKRDFRPKSDKGLGLPEEQGTYDRISPIFRTAFQNTYNLSITGGDAKTNFYIGSDYTFQEATLKLEDFTRYGLRVNIDHSITNKLKIGTSNAISANNRGNVKVGDGPAGFFQASLHTPTFLPIYKEDGSFNAAGAFNNPIAMLENWDGSSKGFRVTNNFYAKYDIFDFLSFKSSWSNDRNEGHDTYYYSPLLAQGSPEGAASSQIGISNYFTTEQTLNYLQSFDKHDISAYAGWAYNRQFRTSVGASGTDFAGDAFKKVTSAAKTTGSASGSVESGSGLVSQFVGANYSYDKRYSVDASVRRDASSRFGKDNRAGYFPSIGAGWNIRNESFFPKTDKINDLRIKGSVGLTGRDAGSWAFIGLWNGGSVYDTKASLTPASLANPELKWESTRQWNVGLNTSLFQNRLDIELNYYDKFTSDLLLNESLPGKTGFGSVLRNSGEMSNKGYELAITSQNLKRSKTYSWQTTFTASRNINKIVKLPVEQLNASYGSIAREGYSLHSFYLYDYLGVDPATGDAVYDDWTGGPNGEPDGKITEADKKIFGNAFPLVEGLLKNTLTYKSFALDFTFYYKYKYDVFNYTRSFLESGGTRTVSRSIQKSSLNYWKEENKDTYHVNGNGYITEVLPRPKANKNPDGSTNYEQRSTRNLEDGSFIRLQNVTFAYSIPKALLSKFKIQQAKLKVTGSNLLLFSKYTGPDPEVNAGDGIVQGLDFGTPPHPTTVLFGIDVTF